MLQALVEVKLPPLVLGFEGHPVRYFIQDGEPWLVAKDLATPLGVTVRRILQSASELPDEDRGEVKLHTPGGPQNTGIVSPSGAYQLICQSRKPVGRRLRKWLADLGVAHDKGQLGEQPAGVPDVLRELAAQRQEIEELRSWQERIGSVIIKLSELKPEDGIQVKIVDPYEAVSAGSITAQVLGPLQKFLAACCQTGSCNKLRTNATKLYEAFRDWSGTGWSQAAFGRALAARGFSRHRGNGCVFWCGIALKISLPAAQS